MYYCHFQGSCRKDVHVSSYQFHTLKTSSFCTCEIRVGFIAFTSLVEVSQPNSQGQTPLSVATQNRQEDCIKILQAIERVIRIFGDGIGMLDFGYAARHMVHRPKGTKQAKALSFWISWGFHDIGRGVDFGVTTCKMRSIRCISCRRCIDGICKVSLFRR